jgi:hypothetical protein
VAWGFLFRILFYISLLFGSKNKRRWWGPRVMFRWWVQGSCSAGGSYFVWVFFFFVSWICTVGITRPLEPSGVKLLHII